MHGESPRGASTSLLNQRERAALLLLTASLAVGCAVAVYDHYRPEACAEFRVLPGAVETPADMPAAAPYQVVGAAPGAVPPVDPAFPQAASPRPATGPGAASAAGSPADPPGTADQFIDLNAAAASVLEQLPGIGPKTAARIVVYREAHGPFASVEELERVPGVGPRTLEKVRPRLRLKPATR